MLKQNVKYLKTNVYIIKGDLRMIFQMALEMERKNMKLIDDMKFKLHIFIFRICVNWGAKKSP